MNRNLLTLEHKCPFSFVFFDIWNLYQSNVHMLVNTWLKGYFPTSQGDHKPLVSANNMLGKKTQTLQLQKQKKIDFSKFFDLKIVFE